MKARAITEILYDKEGNGTSVTRVIITDESTFNQESEIIQDEFSIQRACKIADYINTIIEFYESNYAS